ncbi:glycosyltransferase family 4 protein [Hydrogenophaga sp. PBL-H3]|uniref:glycosyltransferase family 4 protein n=1 Tax=Hydrogenophaga sp. PBL-H3 TaxID=434010 RepID=UPI00131FDC2D|nr:glycosyltransferase family 1 protein [Hydrogenophaga sp. PBL-H3]QHE76658.1 glycosyltransferase family 1 protein [Hydrogenophaga sp. PBL-H3]QHE81082.1 glycosyltransferase family 1 protein [Hydrogenophaga sp. PBL-H3]
MKILLVTDAWLPQVHGLVSTLVELVRQLQVGGHEVVVIQPGQFRTRPCPGCPGLEIALFPGARLRSLMDAADPDAIHIATEGPLGWAARRHCVRRGLPFTTAFHSRFPEMLQAAFRLPLSWSYALLRWFHRPSGGVMVPNQGLLNRLQERGFERLRQWTPGVDTHLFALTDRTRSSASLGPLAHPVSLYVGRLSVEKNLEAFLSLDVPGSKVVCGDGPLASSLRARYPNVHWLGELPRQELVQVYAAADVFVFPGRGETQGKAMLEAMACGVPVAAYPVDGPLHLVGESRAGSLRDDLREAWYEALKLQRHDARNRALLLGWGRSGALFLSHLVMLPRHRRQRLRSEFAVHGHEGAGITKLSHKRHPVVE